MMTITCLIGVTVWSSFAWSAVARAAGEDATAAKTATSEAQALRANSTARRFMGHLSVIVDAADTRPVLLQSRGGPAALDRAARTGGKPTQRYFIPPRQKLP